LTPTSPNTPIFGEPKATIEEVLYLVDLFPLSNLLPKYMMTSGIEYCPAINNEPRKLSTASFLSSRIGI